MFLKKKKKGAHNAPDWAAGSRARRWSRAQTRPPDPRGAAGGNKASARGCHPSGPPPPGAGGFPSPALLPTGAPTRPQPRSLAQSPRRLLAGSLRTGGMRGRARRPDVQPAEEAGPEGGAERLPPAPEEVGVVGPSSAESRRGSRLCLHFFFTTFLDGQWRKCTSWRDFYHLFCPLEQ